MITESDLANWFRYHPPSEHPDGPEAVSARYERLRAAGGELAKVIVELTPPSADQTAAVRKVREAIMTANAAIACERRAPVPEEGLDPSDPDRE